MANSKENQQLLKRIPVKEDLFTMPLSLLEQVRLKGSKCRVCREVFLGRRLTCENCASSELEEIALSKRGKLWSYTVIRARPPGVYKGPEPFIPFALGLVELSEGLRIISPLTDCDVENLKIGMELELVVDKLYEDENSKEVIAFKFKPFQRRD